MIGEFRGQSPAEEVPTLPEAFEGDVEDKEGDDFSAFYGELDAIIQDEESNRRDVGINPIPVQELLSLQVDRASFDTVSFINAFLDRYVGKKNEDRWAPINTGAEWRALRGDDQLILILVQFLKEKGLLEPLPQEFVRTLFQTFVEQMEVRMQENYEREQELVDQGVIVVHIEESDGLDQPFDPKTYYHEVVYEFGGIATDFENNQNEELVMMNTLIRDLAQYGDTQVIDTCLDLVDRHGGYDVCASIIGDVCSNIDSGYGAEKILERIRRPKKAGEAQREYLARHVDLGMILRRIEFGKIGVDDGVVTYLEKQYALQGEQKDTVDFARRITSDGKIGLFDEQGGLTGYFSIGSLGDPSRERQAEIFEVARALLFSDPDTPDEIRQQFLVEYTHFYEEIFGEVSGVRMSDLTLREQCWFYQFWREADSDMWDQVIKMKDNFGIDGVKVFMMFEG